MPMNKLLAGLLVWGTLVPCAEAAIVNASGDALGNGSVSVEAPNVNEVSVAKVFTGLNALPAMLLTLEVDAPGFYAIKETITNVSGVAWDNFSWLMSNAEGVFFFDFADAVGTDPFTISTPQGDSASSAASVYGGLLAHGAAMAVNLQVLVTAIPEGQTTLGFTVIQVPHAAPVPVPGSLALLALGGLPALLGVARRRRA